MNVKLLAVKIHFVINLHYIFKNQILVNENKYHKDYKGIHLCLFATSTWAVNTIGQNLDSFTPFYFIHLYG